MVRADTNATRRISLAEFGKRLSRPQPSLHCT